MCYRDFPGGSDGKASAYTVRDPGSIPGSGRFPGEGNGNPLQLFLPGKSHGRRNLVGYSPWGRKESDTTEWHLLLLHVVSNKQTNTICHRPQEIHLLKENVYLEQRPLTEPVTLNTTF